MEAKRKLAAGGVIARGGEARPGPKKKGVAYQNCARGENVKGRVRFTGGEDKLSMPEAVRRIEGWKHMSEAFLKDSVRQLFHFGFARNTRHRVTTAADCAEHLTCFSVA
jgi:hypothetical protein